MLDEITPENILHNLRSRYAQNDYFTSIGNSYLIYMNSYQNFENISLENLYKFTDTANNKLQTNNQCILLSGERDSGKTLLIKSMLNHLISKPNENILINYIINSAIVLEAFGSIRTSKNDSSSKY